MTTYTDADLYAAAGRLVGRTVVMCDDDTATIVHQALESFIEMLTGHEPDIDTGLTGSNRAIEFSDVFADERI